MEPTACVFDTLAGVAAPGAAHDADGEGEAVAADAEGDEATRRCRKPATTGRRSLGPFLAVIAPHERECYASTS